MSVALQGVQEWNSSGGLGGNPKSRKHFENKIGPTEALFLNKAPFIYLDLVPGAAVTKSPPPVVFCQVGVSHIYVTESQPPVIFMPTQVSHICR